MTSKFPLHRVVIRSTHLTGPLSSLFGKKKDAFREQRISNQFILDFLRFNKKNGTSAFGMPSVLAKATFCQISEEKLHLLKAVKGRGPPPCKELGNPCYVLSCILILFPRTIICTLLSLTSGLLKESSSLLPIHRYIPCALP